MNQGRIYLVRNGEAMADIYPEVYKDDQKNFLSPLGFRQAEYAGAYFKRMNIEFAFVASSDLNPGRHTTACILQHVGWNRKWFNTIGLNEIHGDNGKESVRSIVKELIAVFNSIQGNMLIVTHYHTIQFIIDELTGGDRGLVDSHHGHHVGHGCTFTWNPMDPQAIRLLDYTKTDV